MSSPKPPPRPQTSLQRDVPMTFMGLAGTAAMVRLKGPRPDSAPMGSARTHLSAEHQSPLVEPASPLPAGQRRGSLAHNSHVASKGSAMGSQGQASAYSRQSPRGDFPESANSVKENAWGKAAAAFRGGQEEESSAMRKLVQKLNRADGGDKKGEPNKTNTASALGKQRVNGLLGQVASLKQKQLNLKEKKIVEEQKEESKLRRRASMQIPNAELTKSSLQKFKRAVVREFELSSVSTNTRLANIVQIMRGPQNKNAYQDFVNILKLEPVNRSNHALTECIQQLASLSEIVIPHSGAYDLPEQISTITWLRTIIAPNNFMQRLPQLIGRLRNLTRLDLSNNFLTMLPDEFSKLSSLSELFLSKNRLVELPTDFHLLYSLHALHLDHNRIKTLPKDFGGLRSLLFLNISNNRIEELGFGFGELSTLNFLDVSRNRLKLLPGTFVHLKSLEELHMQDNFFEVVDKTLFSLNSLRVLNIEGNEITKIPKDLISLRNIQKLHAGYNKISSLEIPANIQNPTLVELVLRSNKLKKLPPGLGRFKETMTILELQDNELEVVGEEVFLLLKLTSLNLGLNRKLTNLSVDVGNLEELTYLNLFSCNLSTIPQSIINLSKLRTLNVSSNRLRTIPEQIGSLQALETLIVEGNRLSNLPESLGRCTKLKKVQANNNIIKSIPESICNCKHIWHLSFENNRLSSLPMHLDNMPFLEELNVAHNNIPEISPWIIFTTNKLDHRYNDRHMMGQPRQQWDRPLTKEDREQVVNYIEPMSDMDAFLQSKKEQEQEKEKKEGDENPEKPKFKKQQSKLSELIINMRMNDDREGRKPKSPISPSKRLSASRRSLAGTELMPTKSRGNSRRATMGSVPGSPEIIPITTPHSAATSASRQSSLLPEEK